MKVYIIEDEQLAQLSLIRMLNADFPDIEVIGTARSVKEAVDFLKSGTEVPDIIFMDVELSDGRCFEIFEQVEIHSSVIMTTAYDNYAVKAFETGSVDYLLKPIEDSALHRAVERCRIKGRNIDIDAVIKALKGNVGGSKRFLVRFNDRIVPVLSEDVAYFHSEEKNTFLVTKDNKSYVMDSSLDVISDGLDKARFFRISRNCIIEMSCIISLIKQLGGRLKIIARPESNFDMIVSRSRAESFLRWLEG